MLENYYFYYSYKNDKDILYIYFDNQEATLTETKHMNVSAMYREDGKLHSYRIHDINKIFKIKNEGFIFATNNMFIKIVNFLLENAGFEQLKVNEEIRYGVGKVINIYNGYVYVLFKGQTYFTMCNDPLLKLYEPVVIAMPNAILSNFEIIKDSYESGFRINCHICTEKDLQISNKNCRIQVKSELLNKEFFTSEVQVNA